MEPIMRLMEAEEGKEYIIRSIETNDEELDAFLFSLGCYSGEPITVVTRRRSGCVISVKDARYNIDNDLAAAILVDWQGKSRRGAPKGNSPAAFSFFHWLAAAN